MGERFPAHISVPNDRRRRLFPFQRCDGRRARTTPSNPSKPIDDRSGYIRNPAFCFRSKRPVNRAIFFRADFALPISPSSGASKPERFSHRAAVLYLHRGGRWGAALPAECFDLDLLGQSTCRVKTHKEVFCRLRLRFGHHDSRRSAFSMSPALGDCPDRSPDDGRSFVSFVEFLPSAGAKG